MSSISEIKSMSKNELKSRLIKMGMSFDKTDHPKSYYLNLYLEKFNAQNKITRSKNSFGREMLKVKRERVNSKEMHDSDYNVEEDDNDIVNEGIKSVTDDNKAENNMNFDLKEEQNGENINYEIQELNEPKNNSNFQNLISMNQSGICQCCNQEFDNKKNIPCLLKCNHIFCKICLETYFTEKEE